jgi:hypothetical protein
MNANENQKAPAPRLPLVMNIEFRKSYARQADKGVLKNISLSGAFLETEQIELLAPADKVILTFLVSGRRRKVNATIIWKNAMGCGIQFQPFNNRDVQIVDDLMYFVESKRETRRSVLDDIFKRVA